MTRLTRSPVLALAAAAMLGLTACGDGGDPMDPATDADQGATGFETDEPTGTATDGGAEPTESTEDGTQEGTDEGTQPAGDVNIVVGSADFSESILLAHIYAGALNNAGINASTNTGIGSREIYLRALEDGSVDVLPEYTGALGFFYDDAFSETDPDAVYAAVEGLLPDEFTMLDKSEAENNDSVAVTRATAMELGLTTIADLEGHAQDMAFGAPPEFQERPQGLPGLEATYGLTFSDFRALRGQALVQALANDQVQAANIFSTDPAILSNNFVVLEDTESLFGSQNMVPLVRTEDADVVREALNAVSEVLTTDKVSGMLEQTDVEQRNPADVAAQFLEEEGL
ncbi:MAG: ABC transporter substrate-binding protein [Actinomycetia bacterium]|nr:ABC transporter substrate-binding protein [Actinomycetes bacterium]